MSKQALGAFERGTDGDWRCFKTVTVEGPMGAVLVPRGRHFSKGDVFAGFNDFYEHLNSLAIESPSISPHE